MVDAFVESHESAPEEMVLDLDATDDPIHGQQKAASFTVTTATTVISRCTSSRGSICCAPGCGVPISMGPRDLEELERTSAGRQSWPEVSIVIRADSGFCRDDPLCEDHHVDYVMGLANNDRLIRERRSDDSGRSRVQRHRATGAGVQGFPLPDSPQLDLGATRRSARPSSWRKAPIPDSVVTSLSPERLGARALYEDFYCARGDMENRIKEQQLGLFADRTSAATMRANQLRLYLSSAAYMLMHALRRLGLKQPPWLALSVRRFA